MIVPTPTHRAPPSGDELRSTFGFDLADESWFTQLRDAEAADPLGRLGEYELLEEVARGGQGTVYRARQPRTKRIIAIKRLWAGSLATPTMRARFEREVEAVSPLNHPNIVRIFGTETIDDQPVLAMEWIDGEPIDRWAAAHKGNGSSEDGARRCVTDILQVFALVCDAVNHAHQHGVLHRDLKPSNILVDADDQPHVLDFGLAKLTDHSSADLAVTTLTHGSGFMGTPAYASPEQVAGGVREVDARGDVYSLGVILYEMLTGVLPYGDTKGLAEIFDAIRHAPVKGPSVRRRGLGCELDAIVIKALEKEPARRYQSVDALGADVRRYLNNETVIAHPPSAMYQARKFIARHRGIVAMAAAAVLVLVAGFIGVVWALLQTNAAQTQTRQAEQTATEINAFLNEMLATADPGLLRAHDLTLDAMLDEAVRKLDAGALRDQVRAEAQVRSTIADAYFSLGLYPPAQAQYDAAVALWRQAPGDARSEVADSLIKLANVQVRGEEYDEAGLHVDEANAIRTSLFGSESLPVARALVVRAEIWRKMGREDDARAMLLELLPKVVDWGGGEDTDEVALVKWQLAFIDAAYEPERSIALFKEVLAIETRLFGPEHERVVRTMLNLGATHLNRRDFAAAAPLLQEALVVRRRILGNEHPATANALYNVGTLYRRQHKWTEAEAAYREALVIQEQRLAPGHYETGRTRYRLGQVLVGAKRCEEAEQHLRLAIDELDDVSPRQALRSVHARNELAGCLIDQQRFAEAETVLQEAMETAVRLQAPAPHANHVARWMVRLYEAWGKDQELASWQARLNAEPPGSSAEETQPRD